MDKLSDKNVWSLAETIVNLERKLFDSERRADNNEKALSLACMEIRDMPEGYTGDADYHNMSDYFRKKAQEGK